MKEWLRRHTPPSLMPLARSAADFLDLLHVRKDRSYLHGLLFDLRGEPYSTDGMQFEIPRKQFPRSFRSRLWFDLYEAPERVLSKEWIPEDAVVLELGGCIGVLSCVLNRRLTEPKNHVVVEANTSLIDCLRENRDRNGCQFAIENCVLSKSGDGEFFVGPLMTANRADANRGTRISVPTATLDALESKHGMCFDTLVLDIEGGELEVFRDNRDRLSQFRVILLELHRNILSADAIDECIQILLSAGFRKRDELAETEVWTR